MFRKDNSYNKVKLIKYDYTTKELLGEDGDYYGKYTITDITYLGRKIIMLMPRDIIGIIKMIQV